MWAAPADNFRSTGLVLDLAAGLSKSRLYGKPEVRALFLDLAAGLSKSRLYGKPEIRALF
jgi:hypothetical protein